MLVLGLRCPLGDREGHWSREGPGVQDPFAGHPGERPRALCLVEDAHSPAPDRRGRWDPGVAWAQGQR